jgi:hypothetical protein
MEKGKEIENNIEIKKKIIFQVLGKKHQIDYNQKDFYPSYKKKEKIIYFTKTNN